MNPGTDASLTPMADAGHIHIEGLGELQAISAPGVDETCWRTSFSYRDSGREETSTAYIAAAGSAPPSDALVAFAIGVLKDIDAHLRSARDFLVEQIRQDPGAYGLDAPRDRRALDSIAQRQPFDSPEPTFYAPGEWQLRFASTTLPESPLGVVVEFRDDEPIAAENLHADN